MISRRFILFFFILFQITLFASEKLLIFSYSYNRPDFIEIQYKTFKKFLLDDYEFVIFNDANNLDLYKQIHETCSSLNIVCIDIPQNLHMSDAPSHRNATAVNYSLRRLGFQHPGIVVLLDSDLFLVKKFSIKNYMNGFALAGIPQSRSCEDTIVEYLWVGIVFLDMRRLPNKETIDFGLGSVKGLQTDTGGYTHYYLSQNYVPVKYINVQYTQTVHDLLAKCPCSRCRNENFPCDKTLELLKSFGSFDSSQLRYIINNRITSSEFFLDNYFFHYRGGTNWNNQSIEYHLNKTRTFLNYINQILAN